MALRIKRPQWRSELHNGDQRKEASGPRGKEPKQSVADSSQTSPHSSLNTWEPPTTLSRAPFFWGGAQSISLAFANQGSYIFISEFMFLQTWTYESVYPDKYFVAGGWHLATACTRVKCHKRNCKSINDILVHNSATFKFDRHDRSLRV